MKIKRALISVFHKEGLEPILNILREQEVEIVSTGGTYEFIRELGIPCTAVEDVTQYPSILGGRVKTLHPKIFGGILARRELDADGRDLREYDIPLMDLIIVDLYPFQQTVQETRAEEEIIEKIDIGGISLIRAAAKNYKYTCIVSQRDQYSLLAKMLREQNGETTLEQRRELATQAFGISSGYDEAIYQWYLRSGENAAAEVGGRKLRYGENPHQEGYFYGALDEILEQKYGKELSYNNLVDLDAALELIADFTEKHTVAVLKHTNVCGIATRPSGKEAWDAALAGDPESAFGGVIVSNTKINKEMAEEMHKIFLEILVAPDYEDEALEILQKKKNRILLSYHKLPNKNENRKNILNGVLVQDVNTGLESTWEEKGLRVSSDAEKRDLRFGNKVCKHLKSNAIALVKNEQLLGKGAGQTSRVDALRQSIAKAKQFGLELSGAVMASDAFFPFDDCVRIAHGEGITAAIEPGGSIRDKDTIEYCQENDMALVFTGTRHFKH